MAKITEKYAPRDWSEVIGQPKAIALLARREREGDLGGRAYFITGKSGTGKSTLAAIIASKLAEDWNVEELDASELTADAIRRIQRECEVGALGSKNGRVYIVNEAHGLRAEQVRKLLTMIDSTKIPAHITWIFTTTIEGKAVLFEGIHDSFPLLSRCTRIEFQQRDLQAAFAKRAQEIAIAEGLDGGKPLKAFDLLAKRSNSNFRAILEAIDAGAMLGEEETADDNRPALCRSEAS